MGRWRKWIVLGNGIFSRLLHGVLDRVPGPLARSVISALCVRVCVELLQTCLTLQSCGL